MVSGLARGIDAAVHDGCVAAEGRSAAVLGAGVDVVYPASSAGTARAVILRGGTLLSEFAMATPPRNHHFPYRDRIISGLSQTVVVVRAPAACGALVTADHALDQGRDVMAHHVGVGPGSHSAALAADGGPIVNTPTRAMISGPNARASPAESSEPWREVPDAS